MQQVLFWIPPGIPIYGYGSMLFLTFLACGWLGARLGRRFGIAPEVYWELIVWLFVSGIVGARVTYVIQFWGSFRNLLQIVAIWDGGLVFYGSIFGAIVGYWLADRGLQKRYPHNRWELLDTVAPCIAVGLLIGRVGCLLNGCCFGAVAGAGCPAVTFPLAGAPRFAMVDRGVQTTAGFTLDREFQRRIDWVELGSHAEEAGLRVGDVIEKVNDVNVIQREKGREYFGLLHDAFRSGWPRGKNDLTLVVRRGERPVEIGPYSPRSVPLHPTQLYETISMTLMLGFLLAAFPYLRRRGVLMVLFMIGYACHRFLNEMLRTDTGEVAFGMTLSQNISILVFASALVLLAFAWRRPLPPGGRENPAGATP